MFPKRAAVPAAELGGKYPPPMFAPVTVLYPDGMCGPSGVSVKECWGACPAATALAIIVCAVEDGRFEAGVMGWTTIEDDVVVALGALLT